MILNKKIKIYLFEKTANKKFFKINTHLDKNFMKMFELNFNFKCIINR